MDIINDDLSYETTYILLQVKKLQLGCKSFKSIHNVWMQDGDLTTIKIPIINEIISNHEKELSEIEHQLKIIDDKIKNISKG